MAVGFNFLAFIGSLVCFVPAITLLYFMLERYEGCFEDKKVFLTLVLGLFFGMFVYIFELVGFFNLNPFAFGVTLLSLISSILGIALLHQSIKMMILNMKRFRGKFDTTFYGSSLGLGFGAMYTFAAVVTQFENLDTSFFISIVFIIGIILFHGATGVIIGYGCSIHKPMRYFFYAFLLNVLYNIFVFLYYVSIAGVTEMSARLPALGVLATITIILGALIFSYAFYTILPRSLPENFKRLRRRLMRKERAKAK